MDLYFAPLACSLATRIALYEAGAEAEFIYVDIHTDPKTRRLADGSDYFAINPMGQVPAVRVAGGELITETPWCCSTWRTSTRTRGSRPGAACRATACRNG